jgi:hypothetical protein
MSACGLWLSRRRLVAVVVDDDGRPAPPLLATTDDERWELLAHVDTVHGLDCALILPDDLLRADPVARFAVTRGHLIWTAPRQLVDALRAAAGLRAASRIAAMLGRLAITPGLRSHLRRIDGAVLDRRQLPLL